MIKANTYNENDLRERIIKLALLQWHKPYVHEKQGPDEFDCAGFVWYVYHEVLGIDIFEGGYGLSTTTKIMTNPDGILTYYEEDDMSKDIDSINKGDILLFHSQSKDEFVPTEFNRYPGHAGIYLGDRKFIQCTNRKGCVIITAFDKNPNRLQKLVASKNMFKNNKTFNI